MNQSIFNLVENPNDLPTSNENMAEMFYREILPTRGVADSASNNLYNSKFGGTNISIRWNLDNRTWWIPSRSYIKLDIELTKPGDGSEPLYVEDQVAPNMGLVPSLINRLTLKMNDTVVSSISQFIPQCDTIAKRVFCSSDWLNKTTGNSLNFWAANHSSRLQEITDDGYKANIMTKPVNKNILNDSREARYQVLTRTQLGLGPKLGNANVTPTVAITIDGTVINSPIRMNFTVLNNFEFSAQGKFLTGDLILIKFSLLASSLIYYVREVSNPTRLLLFSIGRPPVNVYGGNNVIDYDITVYRHRDPITRFNTKQSLGAAYNEQYDVGVNGLTNLVDPGLRIPGNLIQYIPDAAGGVNNDQFVSYTGAYIFPNYSRAQNNDVVTRICNWDNTLPANNAVNAAALANAEMLGLGEYYEFTTGIAMGYVGNQLNGHVVTRITVAGEETTLTISSLNENLNPLPTGENLWKPGDIMVFTTDNDNRAYANYLLEIVPGAIVPLYRVCGSSRLANNLIGIDGRNTIVGRFRYKPSILNYVDENLNEAKLKNKFDVIWKPSCLSIFNYPGAIPGGTKYELELQALAGTYTGLGVETPFNVKATPRTSDSIIAKDFQLLVKNVKFYICHVQGPVVGTSDYGYYLNLNEVRTHKRKITSASLSQFSVDVMPSSYALALAFQDTRVNSEKETDCSITKFKVNGDFEHEEQSLERYSIRFAGLSLPQPDAEIKISDTEEFLNNQYIRNQMYTNLFFKDSGGETLQEWKTRGIYFYHPFIRSAGNKETRAYVITQFNTNEETGAKYLSEAGKEHLNAFLFEFYRSFVLIKMKNGYVYSVQTANQ